MISLDIATLLVTVMMAYGTVMVIIPAMKPWIAVGTKVLRKKW